MNRSSMLAAFALLAALALSACGEVETETETREINPGQVLAVNSAVANPGSAGIGEDVTFEVDVYARNNVTLVQLDLEDLGGAADADMRDDGQGADATADDNVWTLEYTIPSSGVSAGGHSVSVHIEDNKGFSYGGAIAFTVANTPPSFDAQASTLENADGQSGNVFGPTETMEIRIAVDDPDSTPAGMTVIADLSGPFGGASNEQLTYNATTELWELDYVGPRNMIPTGGTGNILVTVDDGDGGDETELFDLEAENWVGLDGSDSNDGVSTSAGWTLGSVCATDSAGRIYVAYSSRVTVPNGWQYAVYVKRYDPATGIWAGLGGSDSGYGLCVNTQGRHISSGYVRAVEYYQETNQAENKECVYVLFDGDSDPDDGETLWDTFLYRYNITDSQWESLGHGSDASDYITANPTVGIDDAGGLTKNGERAQEASITFDPDTDDVYVAWHGEQALTGDYSVFVSHFDRDLATPATFAGDGVAGDADGSLDGARFNGVSGIAVRSNGWLYIADTDNHTIRRVISTASTFAGTPGVSGDDDGSGSAASFNGPRGITIDSSSTLYVADTGNHTIRAVSSTGDVTTLAGDPGNPGSSDGTGSGALFDSPHGIVTDGAGNVFVADTNNHVIRMITPAGVVTTFAGSAGAAGTSDGNGSAARFDGPRGLAIDGSGNLYVADTGNHAIRMITPGGDVTTYAGLAGTSGNTDGNGGAARFDSPEGLTVDAAGDLYVADTGNHTLRRVASSGDVTTLLGDAGLAGYVNAPGTDARFDTPRGVAIDDEGTVLVADAGNHSIRSLHTGAWRDFSGATPDDGISDNSGIDCEDPEIRHHDGMLYVAYAADSDVVIRQGDVATGQWTGATTVYDGAAGGVDGVLPALVIDGAGNLYVGWNVRQSNPTDREVHVATATDANWDSSASWVAPDGNSTRVSIPGNTKSTVIYVQLAVDDSDNVFACWNQVHPGSTSSADRGVFLAKFDGSSWNAVRGSLSDDGLSDYGAEEHWLPSLAIDPQGRPVVSYDTYAGSGSGNDRRKIFVKTLR